MSHRPERKEKDCLNCGTFVQGRFCQVCGQENLEPKESFWGMVMHFFNDITHFDGKFFTSLKDLLFRPGFLSAEYMRGRRVSYLNPVRMYVFTSAIFFLVFFSMININDDLKITGNEPMTLVQRQAEIKKIQKKADREDTMMAEQKLWLGRLEDTTREIRPLDMPYTGNSEVVSPFGNYKNRKQYDSVQATLTKAERDGWMVRLWNRRAFQINEKYKYDRTGAIKKLPELILHKLPYLLFISLPFFALVLKLLYVRRKEFYYTDHGIFSIHHYIFTFILILIAFLFGKIADLSGWDVFEILAAVMIMVVGPVYLFIEMKKFYRQGFFKTFFKFCLLNLLGFLVLILLILLFFLFAVFQL